ncbi:hypothetical protein FDK38_003068 [Candidozyma auris]|nr:hypothetical protein FDK38_003068 [[Candida] auris]
MGVTGLLQQLKDIQEKKNLAHYRGKTLAVDTYGWLHRGLISCAQDLCNDAPTRSYITSVMKKVDMLRYFGVEPYMVFDGSSLPTKEATNAERAAKRDKARETAIMYTKKGDRKSAWKEYMKAAGVTPEMAKSIMVELDRKHVKYVVAPYEADPQMVYLEKIGLVDGILSEDSDLLIFGCQRLITKLDDYGNCVEIDRDNFCKIKKPNLAQYSQEQLRWVAILSGCDYTKGIPGVGLKTAFNLVQKSGSLDRIVHALQAERKEIPEAFLDEAQKATLAFQYQKVFNPVKQALATLQDYPENHGLDMEIVELCCGRTLEAHIHHGICNGKLHPSTFQTLMSREQNLATKSSSMVITQSKHTSNMKKAESFGGTLTKSIQSFFQVDDLHKPSTQEKRSKASTVDEKKLSPTSKKLKRISQNCRSDKGKTSEYFKSKAASVAGINNDAVIQALEDSSFITGDSDVPESSPLKPASVFEDKVSNTRTSEQYLTDVDDDFDDSQQSELPDTNSILESSMACPPKLKSIISFPNDLDEDDSINNLQQTPMKLQRISLSWRQKFSLGAEDGLQKSAAQKRKVFESDASSDPVTPDDEDLRTSVSQPKSSQKEEYILSESDKENEEIIPPRSTGFKLSRFAFTGH